MTKRSKASLDAEKAEREMEEFLSTRTEPERAAIQLAMKARERISPAGKLGLPELLDAQRVKYGIPDGAFLIDCVFDRIYVAQVADHQEETYLPGGKLVMPETTKARKQDEACRGVLVGAGLEALDHLRSNGIDLGHIVRFVRLAVFRMEIDKIDGKSIDVMVLRDGDITGSETLNEMRRSGRLEVVFDTDQRKHFLHDTETNQNFYPTKPMIPADY